MKKMLIFLLAFCVSVGAKGQPSQAEVPVWRAKYAENVGKAYAECYYSKSAGYVAMRDGVRLYTTVYRPKDTLEKHPILIVRTPYSSGPYGEGFPNEFNSHYYGTYIMEGYILVFQDVRGRYLSEGSFEQVRPVRANANRSANATRSATSTGSAESDETTDVYDTVEWLLANVPGNNGRVGLVGCSYLGFYAFCGALSGHPAVKAVSPQAPVGDWFMGDDIHHNGAFCLIDAFGFIPSMDRQSEPCTRYPRMPAFAKAGTDTYDFFLQAGCIDSLTRMLGGYGGGFWKQITEHPDYDDFWKSRSTLGHCAGVGPAVLVTGGEYDGEDLYGAINLYRTIRRESPETDCRLAFGPWKHGGWMDRPIPLYDMTPNYFYFFNMELPFFNFYLKGEGSEESFPRTLVFETGRNVWRECDTWPAAEAGAEVRFTLEANATLSVDSTLPRSNKSRGGRNAIATYVSDPKSPVPSNRPGEYGKQYMYEDQSFLSGRSDTAPFMSGALESDVTVSGPLSVSLVVSASTTDADLVVKLIDVDPSGYQLLVRGDIMPARFREGFEKPVALKPGRRTTVSFTMPDVCHTFLKGHRILVVVQSSWFPLFAMNPQTFTENIYTCSPDLFVPSRISIYAGSLTLYKPQVCLPLTLSQAPAGHTVAHKAQVCLPLHIFHRQTDELAGVSRFFCEDVGRFLLQGRNADALGIALNLPENNVTFGLVDSDQVYFVQAASVPGIRDDVI